MDLSLAFIPRHASLLRPEPEQDEEDEEEEEKKKEERGEGMSLNISHILSPSSLHLNHVQK